MEIANTCCLRFNHQMAKSKIFLPAFLALFLWGFLFAGSAKAQEADLTAPPLDASDDTALTGQGSPPEEGESVDTDGDGIADILEVEERSTEVMQDFDITIEATDQPEEGVDRALPSMASGSGYRVLTTDSNLEKIGLIEGVAVLNLNNLAQAVRTQAVPGAEFEIEIVKHGEAENQGVGYLPDGTMVVIDDAAHQIGSVIRITVNNALQTAAGRMIFARKSD